MSFAGRGHLVASLLLAMWTATFIQAHRIFRQSRNTKKAKSAFLAILDKGTIGLKAAMSEEQMSQGLVTKDAMRLKRNFQLLSDSTEGMYALVDYVNFKGEGTKPSESYQGNPPPPNVSRSFI